jgi:hypothetical protein
MQKSRAKSTPARNLAAMMAYAMLGRGMLSAQGPKVEELAADDIRAGLPRFVGVGLTAAVVPP